MLTMLMDDILDISDEEHGNYKVNINECNSRDICRKAASSVEYRVPFGVRLHYSTDLPEGHTFHSDERRIQLVLLNFLTNACKFTSKGEIHLHCSAVEKPGKLRFSVTDTGIGVPADKADQIFGRFTKLDQYTQGSGLGLNICQLIAEKLGGVIFLDQSYTEGARFVFEVDNK